MAQLFSHSNVTIVSVQNDGTNSVVTVNDPTFNTKHSFQVPTSGLASINLGATFTITVSSP